MYSMTSTLAVAESRIEAEEVAAYYRRLGERVTVAERRVSRRASLLLPREEKRAGLRCWTVER